MAYKKIETEHYNFGIYRTSTIVQLIIYNKSSDKFGAPIATLVFYKSLNSNSYAKLNKRTLTQTGNTVLNDLIKSNIIHIDENDDIYLTNMMLINLL